MLNGTAQLLGQKEKYGATVWNAVHTDVEYVEIAYTHSIQTGVRFGCYLYTDPNTGITYTKCNIGLSNWCSYLTTPPDATIAYAKNVIVAPVDNSRGGYWDTWSILGREVVPGPYTVYVIGFGLSSSNRTMLSCTDYNKQSGYGGGTQGP